MAVTQKQRVPQPTFLGLYSKQGNLETDTEKHTRWKGLWENRVSTASEEQSQFPVVADSVFQQPVEALSDRERVIEKEAGLFPSSP